MCESKNILELYWLAPLKEWSHTGIMIKTYNPILISAIKNENLKKTANVGVV